MKTPVYLRSSGDDKVRLCAVVQMTEESASRLEFHSDILLPVDSLSYYYLPRRSPTKSLELWSAQLHCEDDSQEPYTYTAVLSRKARDIPDGWMGDELPE